MGRVYLGLVFVVSVLVACGATTHVDAAMRKPASTAENAHFRLLSAEETATKLAERDLFLRTLTALDRQLRMQSASPVDEGAFVAFARAQARDFEKDQAKRINAAFSHVWRRVQELDFAPLFSAPITFALTTGNEEGASGFDLTYTRAGTVYLNAKAVARADLEAALAHELFHVLTFAHELLRDELYGLLEFRKVDAVTFATPLDALRLTSPEAPVCEHVLVLHAEHENAVRVAFAWSSNAKYRGGGLTEYLTPTWAVLDERHAAQSLVTVREVKGLAEHLHRNTGYLAGPEEILADNFALLLTDEKALGDPKLVSDMHALIARFVQRTK